MLIEGRFSEGIVCGVKILQETTLNLLVSGIRKDSEWIGGKIFVSYKYKDNHVKMMPNVTQPTCSCDYVDYIKDKVLCDDDISSWSEDAIWNT